MIKENLAVYEALRNSILHCEDGIRNAQIYMYSVYFVLLGLGISLHPLLIVSFFVLIAFQTMINKDRIAIERISAYIRVFFESKRNDIHWESLNKNQKHITTYHKQYINIGWYINFASSSILALVSLVALILTILYNYNYKISEIEIIVWFEIVFSLFLCALTIYVNRSMFLDNKSNENIIIAIDKSITKYYNKH